MAKDGYIQIKVRELTEEVKELEKIINDKKEEIKDVRTKIETFLESGIKHMKPLIEVRDKLQALEQHYQAVVEEHMDSYLNEFDKTVQSRIKLTFKQIDGVIENYAKGVRKEVKERDARLNFRFDNLITILNKRGITDIGQTNISIDKHDKVMDDLKKNVT